MRCDDKTEVLRIFAAQLEETPKANFVCFRSGDRKAGTNHISVTGKVRRIDEAAYGKRVGYKSVLWIKCKEVIYGKT